MTWRDFATKTEKRGGDEWVWVAVDDWRDVHVRLAADGRVRLEHLTAYDDGGVWLVSTVADEHGGQVVHVVCGPTLDAGSIDDVYAPASWHQREVSQMFGVAFAGASDTRDAFEGAFAGAPLRRDFALGERLDRRWPGAFEPDESARRRPAPSPGVIPEWSR
jgi:NADH:ubiquinone oxidoreductase subunit C